MDPTTFEAYYDRFDSDEDSLAIYEEIKGQYGRERALEIWRDICIQFDRRHGVSFEGDED